MKKSKKVYVSRNSKELAEIIGLDSDVDLLMSNYKAELSAIAAKAIQVSNLSVNEIVEISGVSRSKVSAIKNGALSGMTCDLFLKVISAAGAKISFKIAS